MEKRLYRSRSDSFLAGVCGGFAEYLNLDVSIVRITWAIITVLTSGLGLIPYIIAIIIIPREPYGGNIKMDENNQDTIIIEDTKSEQGNSTVNKKPETLSFKRYSGLFLILLGAFMIIKKYVPSLDYNVIVAIGLIILGIGMMTRRK